jgi:amino acid adenylation domain-containing protein
MTGGVYSLATPCAAHGLEPRRETDTSPSWTSAAEGTITSRFIAAAGRFASTVALLQDGLAVTYAELDARSNGLARYLQRQGVKPGDLVALLGGRSVSTITAILAVLKAGAGYVPLDDSYPAELLRFMVKDCAPVLVLAESSHLTNSPIATTVTSFDAAFAAAAAESSEPLEDDAEAEDVAYVMYTSGSTGRPKGVVVPHRAVVRLVFGQSFLAFGADETFLHAAPTAFDASTLEIWGALLHGARLAIVGSSRPSLQEIVETIRRHNVTTAWFTAGLFHLLVDQRLDDLRPLRQLIAGGDVLSPTHVARALEALPGCRIVNGYGPTENTTFTCCYEIPRSGWGGGSIPIGTPIAHTYVRIFDDDMRPVADGEVGQLCAGGSGLALGYLGDEQRTSERFVPDPYAAGARLYLTGDLAKRRTDGAVEFIGRHDRQIKIDGKRVELGEIEEALRRNPAITNAVVVVHEGGGSARRLIGYVKAGSAPDVNTFGTETLARLRGELPAHMVPSEIIVLDEFPLTPNGKIDIARLPARKIAAAAPPPKNALESELADIFKRVLGLSAIEPERNFFDAGATSLKLLEAHEHISRLYGDVDLMALFEHTNIRALARFLSGRQAGAQRREAMPERIQRQSEAFKRLRNSKLAQ